MLYGVSIQANSYRPANRFLYEVTAICMKKMQKSLDISQKCITFAEDVSVIIKK